MQWRPAGFCPGFLSVGRNLLIIYYYFWLHQFFLSVHFLIVEIHRGMSVLTLDLEYNYKISSSNSLVVINYYVSIMLPALIDPKLCWQMPECASPSFWPPTHSS